MYFTWKNEIIACRYISLCIDSDLPLRKALKMDLTYIYIA